MCESWNISIKIFFVFFCFCAKKAGFFFVFCKKWKYKKYDNHRPLTEAVFLSWVCGTGLGLRSKYHPLPFITSTYKFEVCAFKNIDLWQALRVHSKFKQSWARCLVEFCKGLEFGKVMRKGKKAKLGEWLKKERKDISRSFQRLSAT